MKIRMTSNKTIKIGDMIKHKLPFKDAIRFGLVIDKNIYGYLVNWQDCPEFPIGRKETWLDDSIIQREEYIVYSA